MNRDDILSMLKAQILTLRDRSKELQSNPRLMQDWIAKTEMIQKEVNKLNSCDTLYLDAEYAKWYNKEIKPYADKVDMSSFKSS